MSFPSMRSSMLISVVPPFDAVLANAVIAFSLRQFFFTLNYYVMEISFPQNFHQIIFITDSLAFNCSVVTTVHFLLYAHSFGFSLQTNFSPFNHGICFDHFIVYNIQLNVSLTNVSLDCPTESFFFRFCFSLLKVRNYKNSC